MAGRPRTFDEDDVLERAVDLFRDGGFETTSVPHLVETLGICRQSLYSAFGDKRGLFLRALERYGQREVDAKLALLESSAADAPLDAVRTVVRGWASLATACPGSGCLTVTAIVETRDDPEVLEIVERQVERLEAGFARTLTRAKEVGELGDDARPERLARCLTTALYGLGVLSRLPGSGPRIADTVTSLLAMLDAAAARTV